MQLQVVNMKKIKRTVVKVKYIMYNRVKLSDKDLS